MTREASIHVHAILCVFCCSIYKYKDSKKAEVRSKFDWNNVAGGYYNAMLIYFVYNMEKVGLSHMHGCASSNRNSSLLCVQLRLLIFKEGSSSKGNMSQTYVHLHKE